MFRFTPVTLSMSPFALFAKDMRRKTAASTKLNMKQISKKYHKLSKAQKKAVVRRAHSLRNPNLDTFNSFQKRHSKSYKYLPLNDRSRVVGILYRQYKSGKPLNFAAAEKEAKVLNVRVHKLAKKKAGSRRRVAPVRAKGKQVKAAAKQIKAKKTVAKRKTQKPVVGKKVKKTVATKKARKVRKVKKAKKAKKAKKSQK